MMGRMQVPQTYYPRESPVHGADPRVKLVLLVAYTVALFVVSTWAGLGLLVLVLVVLLAVSRLPARMIAHNLIPLYVLMTFALVFNAFSFDPVNATAYGLGGVSAGVFEGAAPIALAGGLWFMPAGMVRSLFFCVRVLAMVLASLLVAYSTKATLLTEGFAWYIRPLERLRVPVDDIAFTLMLALRFIPLAFEELQLVKTAQMARGAAFSVGGPWKRLTAWAPVMIPWLVSLYRRANRIACAMDVRAYGLGDSRTCLSQMEASLADKAVLLAGLAFICFVLVLFA